MVRRSGILYLLAQSFFVQEQTSLVPQYEGGIKELIAMQLLVCETTNGGVTYRDLEEMTVPERQLLISALADLMEQRKKVGGLSRSISPEALRDYYAG